MVYRWRYKFADRKNTTLFNVIEYPLERNKLAQARPDKVGELSEFLANGRLGPDPDRPYFDLFFNPDTFGGEEDRLPWADRVIE